MLRKLAVALVATSMLVSPVLAQGTSPSAATPTQKAAATAQSPKAPVTAQAPKASTTKASTTTAPATTVGQGSTAPTTKVVKNVKATKVVKHVKKAKRHLARVKHRTAVKFMKSASGKAFKTLHAKHARHFKTSKQVRVSALTHRNAPAKSSVR